MKTAAVVLAAGASRRLGRAKQLIEVNGDVLIRRAARLAAEAGCRPVVVVLGAHAEHAQAALAGLDVVVQMNQEWPEGMGSSVRVGVGALGDEPQAALLMTVDQVRIGADDLRALLAAAQPGRVAAARYGERLGVPAVFPRELWGELLALVGDAGARRVLDAHAAKVAAVEMSWAAVDIDTAQDLQAALAPEQAVQRST